MAPCCWLDGWMDVRAHTALLAQPGLGVWARVAGCECGEGCASAGAQRETGNWEAPLIASVHVSCRDLEHGVHFTIDFGDLLRRFTQRNQVHLEAKTVLYSLAKSQCAV